MERVKELSGVWLPIITPFLNDAVDYGSYRTLIDDYIGQGIAGLIPLGTTGESPAIGDAEYLPLVEKTLEYVAGRVPVYVGAGGNYTAKVVKLLQTLQSYPIDGVLTVCPYYNRPDQRGIYEHFLRLSEATDLNIAVYNIPYRTGRNIENDTIRRLAALKNIVGLKDSCGDIKQSSELLLDPPADFSIMTGEDALFFTTLALGGAGGILAAAHLETAQFVTVYQRMRANDHRAARDAWKPLAELVPLLFGEPNPAPLKYCLHKMGRIQSAATRLPLMEITPQLAMKLDRFMQKTAR